MKKSSIITSLSVVPLKAPLVQPFRTALGDHNELDNILVKLTLADGTKGWGEAAIATHITNEGYQESFNQLKIVGKRIVGQSIDHYLKLSGLLHEWLPHHKSSLAALEMALVDALTRQLRIPLWRFFGPSCEKLKTDITIVIADLKETEEVTKIRYKQGFRTFKVKVGRDFDLDIKRVVAVDRITKHSALILDANQGYQAGETLKFLKELKKYHIRPALLEQPVPREDWEGLKRVAKTSGVDVCADESIRSLAEATALIREGVVSFINVKLMKFGVFEAREIATLARAHGVQLMIGGMMESSLAMMAGAHFASGLGGFVFVDLDTPFFLKHMHNPYLNSQGIYDLSKVKEGIGIKP